MNLYVRQNPTMNRKSGSTHKCLHKIEIEHLLHLCRLLQVAAEEDETKWILVRVHIDSDTAATVALNQR